MIILLNSQVTSFYIALVTVGVYFLIMGIKKKIIGKSPDKVDMIVNIIINAVILFAAALVFILAQGEFSLKTIFTDLSSWIEHQAESLILSAFVIIISITLYNTLKVIVNRTRKRANLDEKRKKTLTKVILSFARYAMYIANIAILLSIWGIDVTPILAGLGIAGLVIGLGAQKLINDFINGMFIVFERHFDVGDIISIGDFRGEVIDIGLKTTKIKNWKNEVKIIGNGNIGEVINHSLDNSIAVVEFKIPFEYKIDEIIELINLNLPKYLPDNPNILKIPSVSGVTDLVDNSMNLRVIATTVTGTQAGIERVIRRAIKSLLEDHKIEFPTQKLKIIKDDEDGN